LHQVADFAQRRPEIFQKNVRAVFVFADWIVAMSISTRPASANATTSGGDMRKFALMLLVNARLKIAIAGKHARGDQIIF
jgi:hypothetical protein